MPQPEEYARQSIDQLLVEVGWQVCDPREAHITVHRGVANYDVYHIRIKISEPCSKVDSGYAVQIQERDTRKKRWAQFVDDFSYDPKGDSTRMYRRQFGKGNDYAQKNTYPTTVETPECLIAAFRNSCRPRPTMSWYRRKVSRGDRKRSSSKSRDEALQIASSQRATYGSS
jgi:hypothetical protein